MPVLEQHAYFLALRGVADGSGVPLQDIVVLNMRYELLYFQYGVNALVDGCTSFAVLPRATHTGHLLLGQNWDWIPEVRGAVLHTRDDDGLETLSFTEAGIVGGKIGLNSVGLGLAINGLYTTADDWSRLKTPFHVRCYDILRSRTLEQAMSVVTDTPRACSTNFLHCPDARSRAGPRSRTRRGNHDRAERCRTGALQPFHRSSRLRRRGAAR